MLWDYHNIQQDLPSRVNLILVAGSHDDRVAVYGARLSKVVSAHVLVTSGGFGKITSDTLSEPEAVRFKRIMESNGIEEGVILTEETSTNTGENVTRTCALLRNRGIEIKSGIIVTKPHMKRRALATAQKQWPVVSWWVAAPEINFENYPSGEVPEQRMIELMVGDLQSVERYAKLGYQVPQHIPDAVWDAYRELVKLGFDRRVFKGY